VLAAVAISPACPAVRPRPASPPRPRKIAQAANTPVDRRLVLDQILDQIAQAASTPVDQIVLNRIARSRLVTSSPRLLPLLPARSPPRNERPRPERPHPAPPGLGSAAVLPQIAALYPRSAAPTRIAALPRISVALAWIPVDAVSARLSSVS
jgi:hypothetical protein